MFKLGKILFYFKDEGKVLGLWSWRFRVFFFREEVRFIYVGFVELVFRVEIVCFDYF